MKLVIGSDHGGFAGKEFVKKWLQKEGHDVADFGCHSTDPVDYPDIARLVGEAVARGDFEKGVLLDGFSGAVCMAANKVRGVRAVAAYDSVSARFAAAHDDANVLCLGGKTHGELLLAEMLKTFFSTRYEGGRHDARLAKVAAIERDHLG
ncbi:MAG TPA: RpiB/LacA/LacB family sugar-phosphate isomerase [Elusimicrobiota bacterium]|nr:RpiB/LacA/LacB family sugar-phosphate isomerase [Elusimicrobiota bacterium]